MCWRNVSLIKGLIFAVVYTFITIYMVYNIYFWLMSRDLRKDNVIYEHNSSRYEMKSPLDDLDLYLRMFHKQVGRYDTILVPSLRYFWPGNVSLVIVLDNESAEDHKVGENMSQRYPYPRVAYQEPIDPKIYLNIGHERMQRDFFYPEKFTNKTYVGFIDADTMFVTRVTETLLFEDGKPVVIAFYGKFQHKMWQHSSEKTLAMTGKREVMRCMAYFPVIIKVQHIVELRKYVEAKHNMSFDRIYQSVVTDEYFCQFNIFCQYIWDFHRDEYKFYFQKQQNGLSIQAGRVDQVYYEKHLTPEQKVPKPRASIHYRYHPKHTEGSTYNNIIKNGICFSGGFDLCREKCAHLNRSSLHLELFRFEFTDWSWDTRCIEKQREHYEAVAKIADSVSVDALLKGCHDVGTLPVIKLR
ncbi:hypothetical protein ACJMK2_036430 [Sinanodonta woodiana]|uniref:Glycosyltransferase family 92 protein n=1 Tax=Sinanodonta woodiana TaxID=1069815 RepID=A0ABD3WH68_SINWO